MRHAYFFLLFLISSSALSDEVEVEIELKRISDLQWKNRIILVSAGEDSDEWVYKLRESVSEIIDRDIAWVALSEDSYFSNLSTSISIQLIQEIEGRYFKNEHTKVVLIGKDGGVKDASNQLNLPELFALIDGMPMRRAEIRGISD